MENQIENRKEILRRANVSPALPITEELQTISETLKRIADKEVPEQKDIEFPDVQKIKLEGVEIITIKGEKGDRGEPGEKGETGESIIGPQGPKGDKGESIVGPRGRDGMDGESIVGPKGENGKDGSPDTPVQVVEKLESLEGDERLDASAIKGIDERFEAVDKKLSNIPRGGARSSNTTKLQPLTADGVTKIFLVPKSVSAFLLCSDNLPSPLMENNGYTINATRTQITITTDNAPTAGAQLLYVYQSVFN